MELEGGKLKGRQRDNKHFCVVAIGEVRDNFHPVSLGVEQMGVVDGQLQGLVGGAIVFLHHMQLYSFIIWNCIPSSHGIVFFHHMQLYSFITWNCIPSRLQLNSILFSSDLVLYSLAPPSRRAA